MPKFDFVKKDICYIWCHRDMTSSGFEYTCANDDTNHRPVLIFVMKFYSDSTNNTWERLFLLQF